MSQQKIVTAEGALLAALLLTMDLRERRKGRKERTIQAMLKVLTPLAVRQLHTDLSDQDMAAFERAKQALIDLNDRGHLHHIALKQHHIARRG